MRRQPRVKIAVIMMCGSPKRVDHDLQFMIANDMIASGMNARSVMASGVMASGVMASGVMASGTIASEGKVRAMGVTGQLGKR